MQVLILITSRYILRVNDKKIFEIDNVSFVAGGKNKVNNVNLSIENEGDIICLLAPQE